MQNSHAQKRYRKRKKETKNIRYNNSILLHYDPQQVASKLNHFTGKCDGCYRERHIPLKSASNRSMKFWKSFFLTLLSLAQKLAWSSQIGLVGTVLSPAMGHFFHFLNGFPTTMKRLEFQRRIKNRSTWVKRDSSSWYLEWFCFGAEDHSALCLNSFIAH